MESRLLPTPKMESEDAETGSLERNPADGNRCFFPLRVLLSSRHPRWLISPHTTMTTTTVGCVFRRHYTFFILFYLPGRKEIYIRKTARQQERDIAAAKATKTKIMHAVASDSFRLPNGRSPIDKSIIVMTRALDDEGDALAIFPTDMVW